MRIQVDFKDRHSNRDSNINPVVLNQLLIAYFVVRGGGTIWPSPSNGSKRSGDEGENT